MKINIMFQLVIKITLSALLLICLLSMPYGYYQAVRFIAMLGFSLLGYSSYEKSKKIEVIIYIALALLFQPFIKVALGRTIWNVVDLVVAIGLIASIIFKLKKQSNIVKQ